MLKSQASCELRKRNLASHDVPFFRSHVVHRSSRLFPFTPGQIFAAFANADQLATWWGPDGFTNTFEVFEFKAQGRWKFVMHGRQAFDDPAVAASLTDIILPANEQNLDRLQAALLAAAK